ncbi:hypothetical protein GGQ59_002824 [Parvularcula dongshanensis]|uniref:Uncharacterized protein n=1 Tax=Parvularcula dongshanensis TaxID=1173995 RepID=A0A840I7Y1_9PROT|nr:hypothetical protein [Parvularcula dongshanensis]MBB4660274.1 hypothetical protein [Parvularcula dongshanensis]
MRTTALFRLRRYGAAGGPVQLTTPLVTLLLQAELLPLQRLKQEGVGQRTARFLVYSFVELAMPTLTGGEIAVVDCGRH